jgi:hypothetical protein
VYWKQKNKQANNNFLNAASLLRRYFFAPEVLINEHGTVFMASSLRRNPCPSDQAGVQRQTNGRLQAAVPSPSQKTTCCNENLRTYCTTRNILQAAPAHIEL